MRTWCSDVQCAQWSVGKNNNLLVYQIVYYHLLISPHNREWSVPKDQIKLIRARVLSPMADPAPNHQPASPVFGSRLTPTPPTATSQSTLVWSPTHLFFFSLFLVWNQFGGGPPLQSSNRLSSRFSHAENDVGSHTMTRHCNSVHSVHLIHCTLSCTLNAHFTEKHGHRRVSHLRLKLWKI